MHSTRHTLFACRRLGMLVTWTRQLRASGPGSCAPKIPTPSTTRNSSQKSAAPSIPSRTSPIRLSTAPMVTSASLAFSSPPSPASALLAVRCPPQGRAGRSEGGAAAFRMRQPNGDASAGAPRLAAAPTGAPPPPSGAAWNAWHGQAPATAAAVAAASTPGFIRSSNGGKGSCTILL